MRQQRSLVLEKEFFSLSQRPRNRMILLSYGPKVQDIQLCSMIFLLQFSVCVR